MPNPGKEENLDPFILSKLDEINKTAKDIQKTYAATHMPTDFAPKVLQEIRDTNKRIKNISQIMSFFAVILFLSLIGGCLVIFKAANT